ncbi:MAG TPA: hypothetical protein PLC99_22430 [Verrucomicrobiota bacterium]|nr:hypothetical protein [Verrucomicrobiota bacterium]
MSRLDAIMTQQGVPALLRVVGDAAVHTHAGDDFAVQIIFRKETDLMGEFGGYAESLTTVQIPSQSGAVVGDTFTVPGVVTEDDPYPDDVIWTAVQLLSDNGYLRKFAVRSGS